MLVSSDCVGKTASLKGVHPVYLRDMIPLSQSPGIVSRVLNNKFQPVSSNLLDCPLPTSRLP